MNQKLFDRSFWTQLMKYGVVGVLNTVITAAVIYVCLQLLHWDPIVSNAIGYAAGLLNSFLLNSRWTFQAHFSWGHLGGFVLTFGVCYAIQLGMLLLMQRYSSIPPYPQQLLAMGVYTVANFLMNKYLVFKK